jgi:hypothetical protein
LRAKKALEALFEIMSIWIPYVKTRSQAQKLRTEKNIIIGIVFLWTFDDKMEANLKDEFLRLLSLGTRKPGEVSATRLFGPFLNRILKRHCTYMSFGKKDSATFIRSIYESKRCWLKCSSSIENSAMEKHKNIMLTPKYTPIEAEKWLLKAVDLVIPPGTKLQRSLCVPTFSACYELSKQRGGNHANTSLGFDLNLDEKHLIDQCSAMQEQYCLSNSVSCENNVVYQALPEPGKFRIITKGPSHLYTALRGLQGFLLKQWKKLPFSTMVDYVEDRIIFRMTEDGLKDDGDLFISGDYSSATDAMNLDATLTVIKRIIENLGLSDTVLGMEAIRSFRGANIHYPDGSVVKQVRGQLMGHPLSFPLLCIINLSTYMRLTGRTKKSELYTSRFLINGDDILFKGTCEMYNNWRILADDVGLIVNEIKTYITPQWFLINSIFGNRKGYIIKYYNRALAIGHRVKSEPVRLLSQAGKLWNQELESLPNKCKNYFAKHFLNTLNKKVKPHYIKCNCKKLRNGKTHYHKFQPNYFISKQLGGLGLINRDQRRIHITMEQRKVATYFARNPTEIFLTEKLNEEPTSCKAAINLFRKIRPNTESWLIDGKPVHGPLNKNEDPEETSKFYLQYCLQLKSWVVNKELIGDKNVLRYNIRKAFNYNQKLMSYRKIINSRYYRFRIFNYEPQRAKLSQITLTDDFPDMGQFWDIC